MKELSIEEKAQRYDKALKEAVVAHKDEDRHLKATLERIFPELKESKDERIRKWLIEMVEEVRKANPTNADHNGNCSEAITWLEKQGEHLENFDEAEKEKSDFVGDGFIKCFANFLDFKEEETYWLEYMGNDNYNVRSDNLLGKTYHITPCQLYTVFKKLTWLEKQGEKGTNGNDREIPISEQKSDTDFSDLRTWKYVVDAVLTKENGIGNYLNSARTEAIAKELQERFGKIEKKPINNQFTPEQASVLDKHIDKFAEQSPVWSREDDAGFADVMWAIRQAKTIAKDENDMGNLWCAERFLKSLKDKVQLQPKQEWKPSNEQIKALETTLYTNMSITDKRYSILSEFVAELKKLIEE